MTAPLFLFSTNKKRKVQELKREKCYLLFVTLLFFAIFLWIEWKWKGKKMV